MASCPACHVDTLVSEEIAGHCLAACQQCGGVWVGREQLLAMREIELDHPLLTAEPNPEGERPHPERCCASCGEAMQSFKYRGGKVTAERCGPCDRVFFDRGELGSALREWRDGFDVSDDAHAALAAYQAEQGLGRLLSAEGGVGAAGLAAIVLFLWLVIDRDFHYGWGLSLPVGGGIALGFYLWRRRSAVKERREARAHLERTNRPSPRSAAGPATTGKKVGSSRFQQCMFCGARFPAEAKRCSSCDTDVF